MRRGGLAAFHRLLPELRRHLLPLSAGFLFMLGQNWGMRRVPEYFRRVVDEVTAANRREVVFGLLGEAALFIAVTVLCLFLMRQLIIGVSRKIEYGLRRSLYEKLLALDFDFFQSRETGDLMSRCTNDLDHVRTLLGPGIMYIPNSVGMMAFFLPALSGLNRSLMFVVLGVMALVVTLIVTVLPRLRPLFQGIQEQTGRIDSRLWQVLSGMTTLKLFASEGTESRRFRELNRDYLRRTMSVVRVQELLWPSFSFLFAITGLLVILIGGRAVVSGAMTIGELLQFTIMMATLTFPVLSLGWIMSMLQQGISAMGRINLILDAPVVEREDWVTLEGREIAFELKGLEYRYPRQGRPALQGVSLAIHAGELVGITGTIGSGKSTLIGVLTGLLRPPRGMVFIGGVDLADIRPEDLYERIGIVSQSPFLFSRTLAENIGMGAREAEADPEALRRRVVAAATTAGLDPDVATFADGYEQMLGERGITLSGGQKQRAAIARALLRECPVLVMDDSLSSVDAETEARIIANLRALASLRTVIAVSHRISPIRDANRIFVFDGGRLVEQGTHAELMGRGELYARLARLQQMQEDLGESPDRGGAS